LHEAESDEAGEGEDEGVGLPFAQLPQPGVEVAADGDDAEVGADQEELSTAPRAARGDEGVLRKSEEYRLPILGS
jgi:hypothetical protein